MFLSNYCILSLVLKVWNQEKNAKSCMVSFRSSNGRISSHFDNVRLKFSNHVYFMVLSHAMLSKIKILKTDSYDIITNGIINSNLASNPGPMTCVGPRAQDHVGLSRVHYR